MSKLKIVIFRAKKYKINLSSEFINEEIIYKDFNIVNHSSELYLEEFNKDDRIYIHEENVNTRYVLSNVYGYSPFSCDFRGKDLSEKDFIVFKKLIDDRMFNVLDTILKHLLKLSKKRCFNYEIYI